MVSRPGSMERRFMASEPHTRLRCFCSPQHTDSTLNRIVDRLSTLRVLLIITYRPEFQPPWLGRPYVTALTINRMTEREVGVLIDRVVGNTPLSTSARQDIIERTDGIPLFVEEMTKAVLEAESESVAMHLTAAVPPLALAVPASL